VNYFFLLIYHFEAFIKGIGLGIYYFRSGWNRLDLFILIVADVVLFLDLFQLDIGI